MPDERIEAVMKAAQGLNFMEWLKVSKAITRAFVEKEHRQRNDLKLDGIERVVLFFKEW